MQGQPTCGHLVGFEQGSAPVEGLAPEDAAEGAVVLVADGVHDVVHGPAIELLVGQDPQREAVLLLIALHGLKGVVPITCDALVDGQQKQVQAVAVPLIERRQDVREDCRVLATCAQHLGAITSLWHALLHAKFGGGMENIWLSLRVQEAHYFTCPAISPIHKHL